MPTKKLTWSNARRKLSELIPWERNPRQIKEKQAKRLQESFEQFGQPDVIVIGPNNELYNGHQRLAVWMQEFGDIEVDVRVSNRPLTEKEREKMVVFLHKGATGEWDFDVLGNEFDPDELLEWGFSNWELQYSGMDYPEFQEFTGEGIEDEDYGDDELLITCPNCGHEFNPKSSLPEAAE